MRAKKGAGGGVIVSAPEGADEAGRLGCLLEAPVTLLHKVGELSVAWSV